MQKGKRPLGQGCHEIPPPLASLDFTHKQSDLLVLRMLQGSRLGLRQALATNEGPSACFRAFRASPVATASIFPHVIPPPHPHRAPGRAQGSHARH